MYSVSAGLSRSAYARTVTSPRAAYSSGRISRIVNPAETPSATSARLELRAQRRRIRHRQAADEPATDVRSRPVLESGAVEQQWHTTLGRGRRDGHDLVRSEP